MNERITIGGTSYESLGSGSAPLLLNGNGNVKIKWGNKLIDLLKNGKIASEDKSTQIFIVSDESEINQDGIYVLIKDDSPQLWICKDGNKYNFNKN